MKTIKYFTMAALALLMTTACSNDDNDMSSAEPQQAQGITITAQLAPKEGGVTRAVYDDMHGTLVATWAEGEDIAIIYDGKQAIASVTEVAGDGSATIEFEVASGTADNTPCTLVYPASATDNDYKLKSYYKLFATQTGQLTADLDVRVGSGTIQTTTPGLTVTTQLQPQFSIFKLVPTDVSGTDFLYPVTLSISDDQGNVITTATQPDPDNPEYMFYVALPPLPAGVYWFNATKNSGKPYIARVTVSTATEPGKFYISTLKMATIGDVVLSNGKFAVDGTSAQAVIAYIGTVDKYFNHFLAIAPEDVAIGQTTLFNPLDAMVAVDTWAGSHAISIGGVMYDTAISTYYDQMEKNATEYPYAPETITQGWRLPSVTDWRYIFDGLGRIKGGLTLTSQEFNKPETRVDDARPTNPAGVTELLYYRNGTDGSALADAINTACGNTALPTTGNYCLYWSSSELFPATNDHETWAYRFDGGCFTKYGDVSSFRVRAVFAY